MAVIPVPVIDADGITLPEFATVHESLRGIFRDIHGQDIYIDPDSQDGQLLAIFAEALHDTFSVAEATYFSFSPSTAQGVGLSRVVKINGIRKRSPSYSTVDLLIVGQAGTTILGGIAADDAGNRWILPSPVNIDNTGAVTVTATAADIGAVVAPSGTVTSIATPTRGWQTVTNPLAATPGAAVETDLLLRKRQSISTMIPSQTILEGIIGAVADVPGVTRYRGYENDTYLTDANGLPPNSIAIIVEGGDSTVIAQTIAAKKTPGSATYGTTAVTVTDAYGIPHVIYFTRPTVVPMHVNISLRALAGYTTAIELELRQAVVDWINSLTIGSNVYLSRVAVPAELYGAPNSLTYEIVPNGITQARGAGSLTAADVTLTFNEVASAALADVTVTVVP